MNAGDNSLVGGLVSAATLVALNYGIGYATFKNKRVEALIERRPQVINRIPLGSFVVALTAATAGMLTLPTYPRRLAPGGSNDH